MSKYFPDLQDGKDIASVNPIISAFDGVEADINTNTIRIDELNSKHEVLSDEVATKVSDNDYVHTDNNFSDAYRALVDGAAQQSDVERTYSLKPAYATTVPPTLVANTEYYLGETATLSFSLPVSGTYGDYCFVKFVSGDTATMLTVSDCVGDVPVPKPNKTYELTATWNGTAWVMNWRGY